MELSKCRKASLEVSKFGFHFQAAIQVKYANFSGLLQNRSLLENIDKNQDKNDHKIF